MKYIEHQFPVGLAQAHGVDAAVFLRNIYHWYNKNRANGRNYHDGTWWTYNSLNAFTAVFPYWTRRQLERIIAQCKDAGLLLTGEYNEDPMDRTAWYSLTGEGLRFFESPEPDGDGAGTAQDEPAQSLPETVTSTSPNRDMDVTERGQMCHETVKCFKGTDNKPDNKQTDTPYSPPEGGRAKRTRKEKSVPDWKPERFEKLWAFYPKKAHRKEAIDRWDRLKPPDKLIDRMAKALLWQVRTPQWTEDGGKYIPLLSSWLNKRLWEDEKPDRAEGAGWFDEPAPGWY